MEIFHRSLYPQNQSLDLGRCGSTLIDDEIGMQLGDAGLTFARPFQSAGLDEPGGMILGRVLEDRSGIGQLSRLGRAGAGNARRQTIRPAIREPIDI